MAPQVYKAQRCTINVGDIPLEVAMLPDSSYRLSYAQSTEVINKDRSSMLRFCRSKYLKTLLGEEFECCSFSEEVFIEGANKPIAPITFELACLYWQKCAFEGNKKAQALIVALVKRSLYDLADEAFGTERLRQERDRMLADDLSEHGVAQIHAMHQSLSAQMSDLRTETQAERELKLKIQLAELELEQERLRCTSKGYPAKDIEQIGAAPWTVIPWAQKTLGWSDANATLRLLGRLGYSFKSRRWVKVKVEGDLWVLPWSSFDALTKTLKQFKSQ